MITQEELKRLYKYDLETGTFTKLTDSLNQYKAGHIVGSKTKDGYIAITISKVRYFAHRLAWLYVHGKFPDLQIDHIDRNKTNNSFSNLRECSQTVNQHNKNHYANNSSGFAGVHKSSTGNRWRAQIRYNNKKICLGSFKEAEQAHKAYLEAKQEISQLS